MLHVSCCTFVLLLFTAQGGTLCLSEEQVRLLRNGAALHLRPEAWLPPLLPALERQLPNLRAGRLLRETDFYTPPVLGGAALLPFSAPAVYKNSVP